MSPYINKYTPVGAARHVSFQLQRGMMQYPAAMTTVRHVGFEGPGRAGG